VELQLQRYHDKIEDLVYIEIWISSMHSFCPTGFRDSRGLLLDATSAARIVVTVGPARKRHGATCISRMMTGCTSVITAELPDVLLDSSRIMPLIFWSSVRTKMVSRGIQEVL
jgi:hypothetical protein